MCDTCNNGGFSRSDSFSTVDKVSLFRPWFTSLIIKYLVYFSNGHRFNTKKARAVTRYLVVSFSFMGISIFFWMGNLIFLATDSNEIIKDTGIYTFIYIQISEKTSFYSQQSIPFCGNCVKEYIYKKINAVASIFILDY